MKLWNYFKKWIKITKIKKKYLSCIYNFKKKMIKFSFSQLKIYNQKIRCKM